TYYNRTLVALWLAASVYALIRLRLISDLVLSVVVPLLPTSLRIIRERRKQDETADSSERSRSYLDSTWECSLKDKPRAECLTSEARQLQNELFDRRRRAPELPEYLYQSTRDDLERQMKEASRKMIQEVTLALGIPGTTHAQP